MLAPCTDFDHYDRKICSLLNIGDMNQIDKTEEISSRKNETSLKIYSQTDWRI